MSGANHRPAAQVSRVVSLLAVRLLPPPEYAKGPFRYGVLLWCCPRCGDRRGKPRLEWCRGGDGQVLVHTWTNPCGHQDTPLDLHFQAIAISRMQPTLAEQLVREQRELDLRAGLPGEGTLV